MRSITSCRLFSSSSSSEISKKSAPSPSRTSSDSWHAEAEDRVCWEERRILAKLADSKCVVDIKVHVAGVDLAAFPVEHRHRCHKQPRDFDGHHQAVVKI